MYQGFTIGDQQDLSTHIDETPGFNITEETPRFEVTEGLLEHVENHPLHLAFAEMAMLNPSVVDSGFFVSPANGMAYVASRQQYGGADVLIRYQGDVSDFIPGVPQNAVYNVVEKDYIEFDGLLGSNYPNSVKRELIDVARCNHIFEQAYQTQYVSQILINPSNLLDYITQMTQFTDKHTKTISLMPNSLMNARGHVIGRLSTNSFMGNHYDYIEITQNGEPFQMKVDESLVNYNMEYDDGEYFMFEYIGQVFEDNQILDDRCRIVARYEPGIRASIQNYPTGQVMPMFDRFSVFPGEFGNSLSQNHVHVFPFLENQSKVTANKGEMLTFSLVKLEALLQSMKEYNVMEMNYIDSVEHVFVRGLDYEGKNEYQAEAIISPISPHRYGKILAL